MKRQRNVIPHIVIKTIHIRVWSTKVYVHVYSIASLFVCLLVVTRDLPGTLTSRESWVGLWSRENTSYELPGTHQSGLPETTWSRGDVTLGMARKKCFNTVICTHFYLIVLIFTLAINVLLMAVCYLPLSIMFFFPSKKYHFEITIPCFRQGNFLI